MAPTLASGLFAVSYPQANVSNLLFNELVQKSAFTGCNQRWVLFWVHYDEGCR